LVISDGAVVVVASVVDAAAAVAAEDDVDVDDVDDCRRRSPCRHRRRHRQGIRSSGTGR